MTDNAHHHALLLATALDEHPGQVDPGEAGTAGLAHLDVLLEEGGATEETIDLGVRLLAFASESLPEHPHTPLWRYRAGGAMAFLAEVLDSLPHLDSSIAFLTAAAVAAGPDLAEHAAVDAAELIKLRLMVSDDLAAADARRWIGDLVALAPLVHSEKERLNFLREQALAHRWAYPHTTDPVDLDDAVTAAETVLPYDDENRAELLHTLATVQEERHRLTGDLAPLLAAIDAARRLCSLLEDDERFGDAQLILAGLLATRCFSDDGHVDVDEVVRAYDDVPDDVSMDVEQRATRGVLLCMRGEQNSAIDDLLAGTALLRDVTDEPDGRVLPVLFVLAESSLVLTRLAGPEHLWPTLHWTSAAISEAPEVDDTTAKARAWQLEAVEAAADEFGIRTVLERHDVRAALDDAERLARDGTADMAAETRALLLFRITSVRTRWLMDLAPLGEHPDLTLRKLRELVDGAEPHLSPEAFGNLDDMVGALEASAGFALGGPRPVASVVTGMIGRLEGKEHSETVRVELDLLRLLKNLLDDPRRETVLAQISRLTSLAWRVDALPDNDEKDRLAEFVGMVSKVAGPPDTSPAELTGRAGLGGAAGPLELVAQPTAWRSTSSEGDAQQAPEANARAEKPAAPVSGVALIAEMISGVQRRYLSVDVPTDPAALDQDIADLETAFHRDPSPANAMALGSRLRLRDRPGDRAASRAAGRAAAASAGDQVTAWCLADHAGPDLAGVLEARRRALLDLAGGDGPGITPGDDEVLMYLVPGCDLHNGFAATIPRDGVVDVISLPRLTTAAVRAWQEALEEARATPSRRGWTGELDRVAAWAWTAAGDAFTPWKGRRLVLVPMGELGLVPWAAAWREVEGRRRYLVQDNEITFMPAATAPLTADPPCTALFVGNPDRTDRRAATIAESLRTAFHPAARFLGGHGGTPRPWRESPQGRGTPDDVRAAARDGLGLLHLGCRTTSDLAHPERSAISLHDGELPVDALSHAGIGLVTLMDHVTVTSGAVHDDALTAPARLVANGTRSVLSAQWPEPSGALVHLVHHHIGLGLPPGAALRAAQLQLLDPERVLPPGTPADLPHDPTAIEHWAVLAHHGR